MQAVTAIQPVHMRSSPQDRAAEPVGRTIAAETIGCRVARTNRNGRIEAVFEHACNLKMDDDVLVTVLGRRAGNVAHGIRLAGRLPDDFRLRAGMLVHADARRLIFDAVPIEVTLATAQVWTPDLCLGMCDWNERPFAAAMFVRELLRRDAAQFSSEFLANVLRLDRRSTLLTARVSTVLRQLGPATRAGDSAGASGAVAQLIGLGPGLTPAGDDFIIGWLAALTLTANTCAQLQFLHAMCSEIGRLRFATTSVSSQHLDDACASMFSERLSDLCVAIAGGAPSRTLASRLSAQLAVGATSGADAAAGLMFGLFDCHAPDP
jgi:Protein of unknown function (DUF2877)